MSDDCGVIAQQLISVFPNAVSKTKGIIPCFFVKEKSHYINQNDNLVILFDTNETIKVGDQIQITYMLNPISEQTSESEKIVKVLEF